MQCRKCDNTAQINMRQHKLALCRDHYLEWLPEQSERFIQMYRMFTRDERILVAVSGGKDSLVLWDVLTKLGYQADGLYIGLGIDGGIDYSDQSYEQIRAFMADRPSFHLMAVDVEATYGATIPVAAANTNRGREKPCAVCGLSKRHIMNRAALEGGYDVLATGHNLDDEAAILFGNTLTWQTGYLSRQGPVLPATGEGLARKVKPFCRFYERETAAYAIMAGIDYMYDECPYAAGASSIYYKELLNNLEADRPGAKLQFYLNFLRAKEKEGAFNQPMKQVTLQACHTCGQPTTADGQCAFCRTWDKVKIRIEAA
jgi:uncharacterized protein (TIGR00269 family)